MTVAAGERAAIRPDFVLDQAVTGLLVRKRGHRGQSLVGAAPLVIDMAQPAIGRVFQHAVHASRRALLVGHMKVTILA